MASYRPLDWVLLEPATDRVSVGDLLSIEPGGMPIYQVEAVSDGYVAVRDERRSQVKLRSLDGFRWRAATA
jgi:hypothetical protein